MDATSLDFSNSKSANISAFSPDAKKEYMRDNSRLACLCSAEPSATMKGCRPVVVLSGESLTNVKFSRSWINFGETTGALEENASALHVKACKCQTKGKLASSAICKHSNNTPIVRLNLSDGSFGAFSLSAFSSLASLCSFMCRCHLGDG